MQTARHIYEAAPLGSLIRFSNGQPQPPARFKKQVRAWEHENGTGWLVAREPATSHSPAIFILRTGSIGGTVVVAVFNRSFSAESDRGFEIVETPKPGMVRVLTGHDGRQELHHLAPDMASAERWLSTNRFGDMRVDVVPYPDPVVMPDARAA